jgi:P-type Cu+ transporter
MAPDEGVCLVDRPIIKGETRMTTTVRDPVCGMDIDPNTAAGKSEYKGQTYYFCSPGCKKSFDKEPEKYLSGENEHNH